MSSSGDIGHQIFVRRLQKISANTYVISVPIEWLNKYNIGKGDEIFLEVTNAGIVIIHPPSYTASSKALTEKINIDKITQPEILERSIITSYVSGIDVIEIESSKSIGIEQNNIINKYVDQLMGLQISEETDKLIKLQCMVSFSQCNLPQLIKQEFDLIIKKINKLIYSNDKNKMLITDGSSDNDFMQIHYLLCRFINTMDSQHMNIKCPTTVKRGYICKLMDGLYSTYNKLNEISRMYDVNMRRNDNRWIDESLTSIAKNLEMQKKFENSVNTDTIMDWMEMINKDIEKVYDNFAICKNKNERAINGILLVMMEYLKKNVNEILSYHIYDMGMIEDIVLST